MRHVRYVCDHNSMTRLLPIGLTNNAKFRFINTKLPHGDVIAALLDLILHITTAFGTRIPKHF